MVFSKQLQRSAIVFLHLQMITFHPSGRNLAGLSCRWLCLLNNKMQCDVVHQPNFNLSYRIAYVVQQAIFIVYICQKTLSII